MKKIIIISIYCFYFFSVLFTRAQDRAGIYKIYISIDRKLTHPIQISANGNIIQNGSLNATRLSDLDIELIKKMIENTVSSELRAQTECIYRKNRNGNEIKTNDFGSTVRGLPVSSKKTAVRLHEKEYYVSISIFFNALQRTSFGASLVGMKQYRPTVTIRITAYNDQRKPVYRKRIYVNDFEKLQSFEYNTNGVQTQIFQVLTTEQIRQMIEKSLNQLIERGKQ
ncbi:MAG: hypothetical protein ACKO6A_08830 [Bacteroidota bacterium]